MNTTNQYFQPIETSTRPREDRVAPARSVRLARAEQDVFIYVDGRWGGLSPRIANLYARHEDQVKHANRERSLL